MVTSISSLVQKKFKIFISIVYYALASTRKDFTRRLASETSIFRLDLSAATRIYAKKGLAESSFVIAIICVFTFQMAFLGDARIKLYYA